MAISREHCRRGRITTRYDGSGMHTKPESGLGTLPVSGKKPCLLYVPETYDPDTPAAMALMLHGAGGTAEHGMSLLRNWANERNIILAAPASKAYSWDIIATETFGADVMLLDEVMTYMLAHFNINPKHIAIGGFSDGASYALSIGLGNGDLFSHILAFSPGFFYTLTFTGMPEVFISHGTSDHVLPINPCSRRIVHRLQAMDVRVLYREFDGEHIIPEAIAQEAVHWFLK